ncbi:hypothetical protein M0R04_05755 [Candidatus Dojkabacteria bacterium]|jgi:hypothetical protein|nr:hypothetical protein [Candidatus Dojkabacteria bacterium]
MAVKPIGIQSKHIYAYIGSTPTRRVQSLDWNSNFTIDSVFELGNNGVVEDTITLVESQVTMNANEWGTTDLEAGIFGILEQRNVIKSTRNTTGTIRVASKGCGGQWANATVGSWLQVIRTNMYPTTNDAEYVKIVSRTFAGASILYGLSPTYSLTAQATGGDIVTLVNAYTITQDTIDSNPVHFTIPHRYSSTSTNIMYSVILPRCYVDGLTYRIDVDGAAEQNYSIVGEEERLLLGSRREVQSITGSFISYTGANVVFRIPDECMGATGSPYVVYAASNLATAAQVVHVSGQLTVQATIGAGLSIDANTQLIYYYTNKVKKGYKVLTNLDSSIGKLSKGYVEVWMQTGTGTNEKLTRCTGIDLNIPMTRTSVDELGESRSVGKTMDGNLRNEITLTFNKNDLREYAKMLGLQESFDAGTLTEILMAELQTVKNVTITHYEYNSQTTHDATTLLKTTVFEDCNFIGDSHTMPISGDAGLELKFSSQTLNISGSGLPPIYM